MKAGHTAGQVPPKTINYDSSDYSKTTPNFFSENSSTGFMTLKPLKVFNIHIIGTDEELMIR